MERAVKSRLVLCYVRMPCDSKEGGGGLGWEETAKSSRAEAAALASWSRD